MNLKNFYANLFKSNEDTLKDYNLEKLLKGNKVGTFNNIQAKSFEENLTPEELSTAFKNTKNNKTGLDGFPSEFFKVFWKDLKYCMNYAFNKSFDKGVLSVSLRQCAITCLPKKGKPHEHIKNWRPQSMLSVIYKLSSAAIANRIKPHLNEIIDKTQCGFVLIGESTRLVYNIMKFTEDATIPGMVVLIDFEKAFDPISCSFIHKSLNSLTMRKMVQKC